MSRSRVLLLTARELDVRPDTDLAEVTADLLAALAAQPGCDVVHHEIARLADATRAVAMFRPDVVFNACETLYGESRLEPVVPLVLEQLRVAFTGSPARALRQCLRKSESTAALRARGVPVPESILLTRASCAHLPGDLPYPLIVKPEREDGSVGIDERSVVRDARELRRAVAAIEQTLGQPALAQRYVEGREIAVALLGWPDPSVLPPGEITFAGDVFATRPRVLTYASKWDEASPDYGATRSTSAATSPALLARVTAVARRAFDALGLRDYGRVDMRVDVHGQAFVIDVNPNCDLSRGGGFMKAAARAGLRYRDAVGLVLRGALRRGGLELGRAAS